MANPPPLRCRNIDRVDEYPVPSGHEAVAQACCTEVQ